MVICLAVNLPSHAELGARQLSHHRLQELLTGGAAGFEQGFELVDESHEFFNSFDDPLKVLISQIF